MTASASLLCSCLIGGALALGCDDDAPRESPWSGQTFLVEVPSSSWAEPRGVGTEFGAFVPQFLLEVESGTENEFEVHIGTARGGEQDRCGPTTRAPAASQYPAVQIGPSSVDVHIVHDREPIQITATILNFTLQNVLPGAAPPDEGELTGMMDARELYPMFTLLGPRRSADTVCTAVASFGTECAPCPTDGAAYCLAVRANYFGARAVPMQLEPIAAQELDPACLE
ncbi:MAG: hypothetical protein ABI895_00460 [Deltaproteobacteria bacterium]